MSHRGRGGGSETITDRALRSMSTQFGRDFSGVRLHIDDEADERARGLGTEAVTEGHDIYFRKGAFDPDSPHGKEVLAHELAHVVQQEGQSPIGDRGAALEHEAMRAGAAVAAGERPKVTLRVRGPIAQRFAAYEHSNLGSYTHQNILASDGFELDPVDEVRLARDDSEAAGGGKFANGMRGLVLDLRVRDPATNLPAADGATMAVQLSYGEVMALSGDLYYSLDHLKHAPADEVLAFRDLIAEQQRDPEGRDYDIEIQRVTRWRTEGVYQPGTGASEGIKAQYWGIHPQDKPPGQENATYIEMASNTSAHFTPASGAEVDHGPGAPEGNAAGDNRQAWTTDHDRAIAIARRVREIKKGLGLIAGVASGPISDEDWRALENDAYLHNAAADHYLTDAFAAGHLLDPAALARVTDRVLNHQAFEAIVDLLVPFAMKDRSINWTRWALGIGFAIEAWVVKPRLRGALSVFRADKDKTHAVGLKLVHDWLNERGVEIRSKNGRLRWQTMGDGHLDAKTRSIASRSVLASRNYIRALMNDSDTDLARPENADDAFAYTPDLDATAYSALCEPVMRYQLSRGAYLWTLFKKAQMALDDQAKQRAIEQRTAEAAKHDRGGDGERQPSSSRFTNRMIITSGGRPPVAIVTVAVPRDQASPLAVEAIALTSPRSLRGRAHVG